MQIGKQDWPFLNVQDNNNLKVIVTSLVSSAIDSIQASLDIIEAWDTGAGAITSKTQRVVLASDDAAVASLSIIDDWDESDRAKVNPIVGQTGVAAGAGAVTANTARVTLASDDPGAALLRTLPEYAGEVYYSPVDFQAAYTSNVTITVTGSPFDIDDANTLVYKIYYKPTGGVWIPLINMHNGVTITSSSNVITVAGAGTPFTSGDSYIVIVLGQKKSYDNTTDTLKITEQAPISNRYVQDSLVDTTNTSAATTYFPATTGQAMDGYRDLSFSGKFITTGTLTMWIEATNDEDTTNADWVQVYGYDAKNDAYINGYSITNTTLTFALMFNSFNFSSYRVKVVDSSSTNTYIIKARKVY